MNVRPRALEVTDEASVRVLEARAERLRAAPGSATELARRWVAQFRAGDDLHAVPLEALVAAVPLRFVTPVPLSPPQIIGIVRHAGEVLPAYSLSALLGGRGWRQDPSILLILELGGRRLALDCEEIPRAVALPAGDVEHALATAQGPIARARVEGDTLHLLDVDRLISEAGARDAR